MKRIATAIVLAFVATGCASTTVIRSNPSGAKVYDQSGNYLGCTPYRYSDRAIVGHTETFVIKHDDHEPKSVEAVRDNIYLPHAILFGVSGVFFWPSWSGLLWSWDYKPSYMVDLTQNEGGDKVARAQ